MKTILFSLIGLLLAAPYSVQKDKPQQAKITTYVIAIDVGDIENPRLASVGVYGGFINERTARLLALLNSAPACVQKKIQSWDPPKTGDPEAVLITQLKKLGKECKAEAKKKGVNEVEL